MCDWTGGIDVLPGFRVIPDSQVYAVTEATKDLLVLFDDGEMRPCTIVMRFSSEQRRCLDFSAIARLLAKKIEEKTERCREVVSMIFAEHVAQRVCSVVIDQRILTLAMMNVYVKPIESRAPWAEPLELIPQSW